ncbi:MAG TPA: MaoC family dehydratase [Victivallales bacterium]|nr:MaoC family dehydratase [Victivallales bacterium]
MQGKSFKELSCEEEFFSEMTVTESHLILFAELIGDFNPVHTDEEYCKETKFRKRCMHGAFTNSFITAPIGQYFFGTALALLELNTKFKAPVFPGDTLRACWKIETLTKKTNSGLVNLKCECQNNSGVIVAISTAKILIK